MRPENSPDDRHRCKDEENSERKEDEDRRILKTHGYRTRATGWLRQPRRDFEISQEARGSGAAVQLRQPEFKSPPGDFVFFFTNRAKGIDFRKFCNVFFALETRPASERLTDLEEPPIAAVRRRFSSDRRSPNFRRRARD